MNEVPAEIEKATSVWAFLFGGCRPNESMIKKLHVSRFGKHVHVARKNDINDEQTSKASICCIDDVFLYFQKRHAFEERTPYMA